MNNLCHKCGLPFGPNEFYISADANIGACAAGAGNWVKYHQRCSPIVFHGPIGYSSTEVRDAALEEAAAIAIKFTNKCDEVSCKAVGCDSWGVKCEEAIAHAIRSLKRAQ